VAKKKKKKKLRKRTRRKLADAKREQEGPPLSVLQDLTALARACPDRKAFDELLARPVKIRRTARAMKVQVARATVDHLRTRPVDPATLNGIWQASRMPAGLGADAPMQVELPTLGGVSAGEDVQALTVRPSGRFIIVTESTEKVSYRITATPSGPRIQKLKGDFDEASFKPKGDWTRDLAFTFLESMTDKVQHDRFHRGHEMRFGVEDAMTAIQDAFTSRGGWYPKESFRLSGVDPDEISHVALEQINAGTNGKVFEVRAFTPSGVKPIILQACQDVADSKARGHLQRQHRNCLFFKFNIALNSVQGDALIPLQTRQGFPPRPHSPPELVEHYLETFGRVGDEKVYMFTAERGDGVELNRFEGEFIQKPPAKRTASKAESLALGKAIIKALAHAYACTYNPLENWGIVPSDVNINNGDFIAAEDDWLHPNIRWTSMTYVLAYPPQAFVDELLTPRNYERGQRKPNGWIIPATPENLPHIMGAVEDGVREVHPQAARELTHLWFLAYASMQESDFNEGVQTLLEVFTENLRHTVEGREGPFTPDGDFEFEDPLSLSVRMRFNPVFREEFALQLPHKFIQNKANPDAMTTWIHGEVEPKIVKPELIQAIMREVGD